MSTDLDETDLEGFVGRSFEGGEFTVERWMVYLWADATENPDDAFRYSDDGVQYVPPTFGQVIARQAAGINDIEVELRGDDGTDPNVFLGGQRFSFDQPLRVGETYRASAEITELAEKSGTSGDFNVLTVTYTVEETDGTPAYEMETDLVVQQPGEGG